MWEDSPILVAALTGFISGLVLSIPVGPVNLTILNEGARRGFFWACMIGLGASAMEVLYCTIAFTGFSSYFENRVVKAVMELFTFVFLIFLGIRFLLAKTVAAPLHLGQTADRIEERIEERLHPHSAFWIGFVRVMANPGVLIFWIILAVNFVSREWVPSTMGGRFACVAGVGLGTSLWFTALSYGASLGHRKISEKTLLRMEHFSGLCLLVMATFHGGRIVWQMVKHSM